MRHSHVTSISYPVTLSLVSIFIVIPDIICLFIFYPETLRIYAYSLITPLCHNPQFRSTAAQCALLSLLAR
jgi:hypothetical protein